MAEDIDGMSMEELERRIRELPPGYLSIKTIRGKERYYHQWYADGRQHTEYVRAEDFPDLKEKLELRKRMQARLSDLREAAATESYRTRVVTGSGLEAMAENANGTRRRDCYGRLRRYLESSEPTVAVLYGLRRTGKTMLIYQALADMSADWLAGTAYIVVGHNNTITDLNMDLVRLRNQGYGCFFIDEVTKLRDFIDNSYFFADVLAATGARVVLTGTDSLGFWVASRNDLYGKAVMIHTTWIPFREHSRILGTEDIDDYIRMGGVLRHGETSLDDPGLFVDEMPFDGADEVEDYVGLAISKNIENTLSHFDRGTRFRELYGLHMVNEFTGVVNRIVEDINHRFVLEVLERDFASGDLWNALKNIRQSGMDEGFELEQVDYDLVVERLKGMLGIKDASEREVEPSEKHASQLRDYLFAMDVFARLPAVSTDDSLDVSDLTVCIQPGLRYFQATALIDSLATDGMISRLDDAKRSRMFAMIRDMISGQILEEAVIYDTMRSLGRGFRVFKLFMPSGEVDMVVQDTESGDCVLVEVKHSVRRNDAQFRHLVSESTRDCVEGSFGRIVGRYVLYRGEDAEARRGVRYLNVENYLVNLPGSVKDLFGNRRSLSATR